MSRLADCAATLFAGLLFAALATPSTATTTPADAHLAPTRFAFSSGTVLAEVDGPRCRNRREICRRYATDARTIRCLERFGCFTGPNAGE